MKRRKPPSWWEFIRVWLWPRRSWMRSGQYVTKRILRLTATPHAVAAGVAVGAFTSFSPFMGFHFVVAFLLATLVRGNLLAAALGTFVGNPLTFPLIWAASYKAGHFFLQTNKGDGEPPALGAAMKHVVDAVFNLDMTAALIALNEIWTPILYPMMIGGFLVGPFVAVPLYLVTRRTALAFKERRRTKLMKKATQLRDQAKARAKLARETLALEGPKDGSVSNTVRGNRPSQISGDGAKPA